MNTNTIICMRHSTYRTSRKSMFLYPIFATFLAVVLLCVFSMTALAQDVTVEGEVVEAETGDPIPGVTVLVEGTTTGTTTDIDGLYTLTVPSDATLVFSFVGFTTQNIAVDGRSTINVELSAAAFELDEAIVTAFGLVREERSLGTSVGRVTADQIAEAREVNVAQSLSGRVAGVQVGQASSGTGGSSNVLIRGISSLGGENQPLYVIDGVPMDNTVRGQSGRWGGYDRGDGIQNLNPNDIEDISVLKGPNAAALYGQRGANGVILITTKSGEAREGIGVEINTSARFGSPVVWPDWQNEYGNGINGQFRHFRDPDGNIHGVDVWENAGQPADWTPQLTTSNNRAQGPSSWGPRMEGQTVYDIFGNQTTFTPQPDNARDFFQTEKTFDTSVALSGGDENGSFRVSLGNIQNQGIIPTNDIQRYTINFRGDRQLGDRLNIQGRVNFTDQSTANRPGLADQQRNHFYQFRRMPREVTHESMIQYEIGPDEDFIHGYGSDILQPGYTRHWSNATFTEQPYWIINNTPNKDTRTRIIGSVQANFELNDWASIQARVGSDFYTDKRRNHDVRGTRVNINGGMSQNAMRNSETNVEALLMTNHQITEDLSATANIGGNWQRTFFENVGFSGSDWTVENIYTIQFLRQQNTSYGLSETEIQSVFAFGQFNWRDWLYLDWTARNDWASTLPSDANSFFYPSLTGSFIWSDAFNIDSDLLDFGSLRLSWAQAGSSGSPYQLSGTYSPGGNTIAGQPVATFTGSIPFVDLENELTTSYEVGTDLRFLDGRFRIDASYYHSVTENQILPIQVSQASGYFSRNINAGEIQNSGIEVLLEATPVIIPGEFQWDVMFNFARNRNEVVELIEGVDRLQLGNQRNVSVYADPGQPFGAIYTDVARYLRDDNGNRMIDPDGLPIREEGTFRIGNAQPDWTGGITNTFSYRNFTLNTLIDIQWGGEFWALSNSYEVYYGTTNRTVEGRDGSLVADGVVAEQNAQGEWVSTGQQNTTQVTAQDYWNRITPAQDASVGEEYLTDATHVSMREVRLGYNFPLSLINQIGLSQLRVSVVGRNLFYLVKRTDGIAPEASGFNVDVAGATTQSSIGMEAMSTPITRSIGFNLTVGL